MPRKYYYGFLPTKFHHIGIEIEFNSAREKRTVHAVPVAVTADTIGRFAWKLSNQARNLATRSKISCGTYGEGSRTKYTGSTLKVCCTAHRRPRILHTRSFLTPRRESSHAASVSTSASPKLCPPPKPGAGSLLRCRAADSPART